MKPYRSIKLTECPDMGDLQADGRSRNGDRPVFRDPRVKKQVRRYLKRVDKARMAKEVDICS